MLFRRLLAASLFALALAACGGAPSADSIQAPLATAQRSTLAPPPTAPAAEPAGSAPTAAAAPTDLPTSAPPTAAPRPTDAPPTALPATQAPPAPSPAPATAAAQQTAGFSAEILFLRKHALIAFDTATRKERQLATDVIDFVPAPSGSIVALIREQERGIDLWSVRRDGSSLTQLTSDGGKLVEATPSWAPDELALAYAASASSDAYAPVWPQWSLWCTASTIHVLDLQSRADQAFGRGCDPAISPDGKRIVYAVPPTISDPDIKNGPTIVNTIRLINRLGQNGWNFAKADGPEAPPPNTGRLVYAPAWSPDSKQIVYQRFLGYQALVDLDLTEISGSFEGKGQLLGSGAGWLQPARFRPDGAAVAVSENNPGDARGFGGYDNWAVTVTSLSGTQEIALPSGMLTAVGQQLARLPRAQAAAWAPDGAALAVQLPPGWNPQLAPDQPVNADGQPGEIWRWRPGQPPEELLVKEVDFASPLAWLPARS